MKKLKLFFLLAGLLSMWQVRAQIAPPVSYQNVPFGNQTITSQTITGTDKWYRWITDAGIINIDVKFTKQGNVNQLSRAELYTVSSGSLNLVYTDYISNSTFLGKIDSVLDVYTGPLNLNDEIYFRLVNASSTCTSCTVANPIVNIIFQKTMIGCTPDAPCDMVKNGGFESTAPLGSCGYRVIDGSDCWVAYENTTDVYRRGCTTILPPSWSFNLGTNTAGSNPILNSRTGAPPNNTIIGQFGLIDNTSNPYVARYSESIQSQLTTSMVPGRNYQLSFWVYNHRSTGTTTGPWGTQTNPMSRPCWVSFAYNAGFATAPPPSPTSSFPTGLTRFPDFLVTSINTWTQFTYTFTFAGSPSNVLLFGPNIALNESSGYMNLVNNKLFYLAFDDISLKDITPKIIAPITQTICVGATASISITNPSIANVYTWTPTSSVLSGQGTPTVIVNPSVTTTYTVTDGCTTNTAVVVVIPTITLTASASTPTLCAGSTATLYASGATSYTWQPGSIYTGTTVVSPLATSIYTVIGTNTLGCKSTKTVSIVVITTPPTLTVTPNQTICPGATRTLTASGATSYTWQPGGVVSNSIVVTPSVTTIYTVTGTGVCGFTAIKTITITVLPKPTISITSTLSSLCSAASTGSTTVLSYATSPSGTSATWVATNATSGTILPVPITGGASTATVNLTSYINYTANINFVATYTSSGGCIGTQTITLYACCTQTAGVTKYTNTTFTAGNTFTATAIILSGAITVNAGNLTFLNTNVYLDPNTKIILNGTSNFLPQNTYMHGCNAMWDGIYAMGTANQIGLTGCRIEDAKRAIVDSLGIAKLNVINSYFNKNQIGIVIKGSKPATYNVVIKNNLFTCSTISVTPSTWFSVAPVLTNSTTIGAFPSTTMLPPYNMYNSYCGVYLYNANQAGVTNSVITVGGNNIFDKTKAGIVNYQSSMDIKKNVFQNITSTMNNPGDLFIPNSGAVFVANYFGTGSYYSNIGGTLGNTNTFYNNEYGVYNIGKSLLNVLYNKFENQTNGVYIYANATNSVVNIASNKFINNTLGVNCYQNNPSKITVQNNWFDNTVSCGNTASNFAIRFTEIVLVTTPASFPKYDAYNNYINGYYNGIKAAQTFSTQIRDNEVHMRQDLGAWNFQFGIHTVGGNNNSVYNNIVDVPTPTSYWWQAGIFTDNSVVPKVHCNTVSNICYGLAVNSICYTAAGDGFYGNTMKNNYQGFTLGAAGEIGNQFKPGPVSADNAWIGCTNETSTGNSCNMSGSVFYTRSTTPYSILTPTTNLGIPLNGNPTTASTGTCNAGIATPTLGLRLGGAAGLAQLMQKGDDIANNAVGFTGAYASSLKQIARKQLYSHLALQQIDPSVTANVNAFANSSRMQPTGRFFMVDSLINTGDSAKINNADVLNTSVRVVEDVDITQKQFNALYIAYLKNNSKVTANTVVDFESIAWLCPTQFGSAVHQARTVLFNITKKRYYNVCELGNTSIKAREYIPPVNNTVFMADINVYPNPANDLLFIDAKDYNYIDIKLYNIMGELVIEKTIDNASIGLDVSKLANGIYVYKAFNNGLEIKVGKLIISK